MTIGQLVEWMISFRDDKCKTWEEKDLMADAINLIDHNFPAESEVYTETEKGIYNR